ncbi:MAG: aldehyde dehydrogenase family protein [Bryobacteraceae bacterium]|nr:aldehyde dehydrogenase family protein [Bryobacteraceae bacterium]MDW8379776.1 aldehyde dehydrogenase family protein [Bryobacterales bacterium]
MLHLPILRHGRPYRSLSVSSTPHFRTKEPFVELSLANPGLIRRDLLQAERTWSILQQYKAQDLLRMTKRAAEFFLHDPLPLGEAWQTPEEYVAQISATTGLPLVMVRKNMMKIYGVMAEIDHVISGLTRGIEPAVLDEGYGEVNGHAVSFFPRGYNLGVVLPNNSPGVHSLWIPAIAMKIPLVLKPGSAEPWSPYRVIQALIKAGFPPEVFSYYPTDHAGAGEILRSSDRCMLFGDVGAVKSWRNDPRVELHGPGYSKIVIGGDCIDHFDRYLDVMIQSIAENSGRSCINASGVWVPRRGREIADALAQRLARIEPKPADDPDAQIAPFADPRVAERISNMIDKGLYEPGAEDYTARYRPGGRLVTFDGATYLLPTILYCESPEHGLANREFLFPFASVVECPEEQLLEAMGPTLVVTAITHSERLKSRLLASSHVGRLNLGPIPTMKIGWDQPHEGNLFEHLYARRAFQQVRELVHP